MKKVLFVAAIGVAAVAAKADSIVSYTNTIPSTLTDWTNVVSFTKFNPALGTLQSVYVQVGSAFSTTLGVTNTGTSASSGSAQTTLTLNLNDTTGVFGYGTGVQSLGNYSSSSYGYSLSAGQGTASGLINAHNNDLADNGTTTDSTILSDFTGTGTVDETAWTFTQTFIGNSGGNTSSSQVTDANAKFIITYDYIVPAPEPSTFAMIGSGLAGLGLMIRRRSSK